VTEARRERVVYVCARVTLADRFGDCVGVLCLRATTVTPRHLSE